MRNFIYIISEYNPPHGGHAYLIKKMRERIPNATVIAVMSGNFVERGSPAIVDRFTRAKAALSIGVDLVLSLPFPHAAASAEFFAAGGVSVASSLAKTLPSDAHYLAFGSESGDIGTLTLTGTRLADPAFREKLKNSPSEYHTARGIEKLFTEMYGQDAAKPLTSPNDTLAVEYIRAIKEQDSPLIPITEKRIGAAHDSQKTSEYPSASAVRAQFLLGESASALSMMPDTVASIIGDFAEKYGTASEDSYGDAILGAIRKMKPSEISEYAECAGGVGERLLAAAKKASSYAEMLELSRTKQYTDARLRRASVYAYLGVTKSELHSPPTYTQLLAANEAGTEALKKFKRSEYIEILTKPADHKKMSAPSSYKYLREAEAELLYTMAYSPHLPSDIFLRQSPTIINSKYTSEE